MRRGIAVAGTIVADLVKMIDRYPEKGMLAAVTKMHRAVGGCVPNTSVDLAVIDPALAVYALGCTGDDGNGEFVKSEMARRGVDVSHMTVSAQETGFTDVMTVQDSGERTFFARAGANADFDFPDGFLARTDVRLLHVGYISLLGKLDMPDAQYGTLLVRRLHEAQSVGIDTSVDLVSSSPQNLRKTVIPALRYCDYVTVNETEACAVADLAARDGQGRLLRDNILTALERLAALGVRKAVTVHCPEAGFMRTQDGRVHVVPSLCLPKGYIQGSVGAGDAFCAACLYGFYREWPPQTVLEFASGAAACNLSAADSVSGMRSKEEIEAVCAAYPRKGE